MKRFLSKLFVLALLATSATAFAKMPPTPTVHIQNGALRGVVQDGMHAYLGIPYAKPPVGELRWRAPQPVTPWQNVFKAERYGQQCSQNNDLGAFATAGGSEDCLTLNVFVTPKNADKNAKRPVMVWIHGGSLFVGGASDYNPRKLAEQGDAVVVTINYRLGIFGFFAHPEMQGKGPMANFGLLDQQLALDWVQQNIAQFGGDPNDVTIFGESSGGNSVVAQMASPWSKGKFQNVIAMSGAAIVRRFPAFGAPRPLDAAQKVGQDFAAKMGCSGNNQLDCLRQLPATEILANQTPFLINQVIIDGDYMPEHPADIIQSGKANKVNFVNGDTLDEGSFFVGFPENETGKIINATDYRNAVKEQFGTALGKKVLQEYPVENYLTPSEALARVLGDSLNSCPTEALNKMAAGSLPTYGYEFADRTAPSYLKPTSFALGAAHTYELPYIFPGFHGGKAGLPVQLNSMQEKLSDEMVKYWTSVSRADQWQGWNAYNPQKPNYLTFVLPAAVETHRFSELHHCEFWDKSGLY